MSPERVKAVLDYYDMVLERFGDEACQFPAYGRLVRDEPGEDAASRNHLRYMIPLLKQLLDEGRIEKAMRWFGFIQGVLWAQSVFTLDELKDHSRPDVPPPAVTP